MNSEQFLNLNLYIRSSLAMILYPIHLLVEPSVSTNLIWGILIVMLLSKGYSFYKNNDKLRKNIQFPFFSGIIFIYIVMLMALSEIIDSQSAWILYLAIFFLYDIATEPSLNFDFRFFDNMERDRIILLTTRLAGTAFLFVLSYFFEVDILFKLIVAVLVALEYLLSFLKIINHKTPTFWDIFYYFFWFLIYIIVLLDYVYSPPIFFYGALRLVGIGLIDVFFLSFNSILGSPKSRK